jgi:hypothetical protein
MYPITAIVLSREPVKKLRAMVPDGITPLNFISDIRSFKSYQRSWLMAIRQVVTNWFFFLDDDDRLPPDFLALLPKLMAASQNQALVYTNELLINDAGVSTLLRKQPYSQNAHIKDPGLLHHLVLGRTPVAQRAMLGLPRGEFMPEPMLYFQMAKEGAAWVDEVGYHWHRGAGGMSFWPSALAAQAASSRWCASNCGGVGIPATPISEPKVEASAPFLQEDPKPRRNRKRG